MDVVLLGIQGAGKGSVVIGLQSYLDFTLVSVGQLLRDEAQTGSELGKHIHQLQASGTLVETHIVEQLLRQKLKNRQKITIFDGFPRTVEQAELLDKILKVDLVVYLKLSKEVATKRLLNRLTCSKCGFVVQADSHNSMHCPMCNGNLEKRSDDNADAISKRFKTFEQETLPLVERYKNKTKVVEINANQKLENVINDVLKVMNEYDD